jgi:signal transduction histidine kinase/DNA-binding NarL/FixJ family response regulator
VPNTILLDHLYQLFSIVAEIGDDGYVSRASDVLKKYQPQVADGSVRFFESFSFKRPSGFSGGAQESRSHIGELFLGIAKSGDFAVRGQVIQAQDGKTIFLGVPWLWWMHENVSGVTPKLSEFPVHDVQMDQLLFMSTQKTMVDDVQALNADLMATKSHLERTNVVQQSFFNHVSHEMRSPLNGVISALTLISDEPLSDRVAELLRLASHSADRLLEVINFSLESAAVEAGAREEKVSNFDLDMLIDDQLSGGQPRALNKNIELIRSGDLEFPSAYQGQQRLLKQALANLLSNAIKFTPVGSVHLGAELLEHGQQFDRIRFYVQDEGPGIPEHQLEKIFDPFATGLVSGTGESQGTGLGLSIVKRYVKFLGGEVRVDSIVGAGSQFSFEIELRPISRDKLIEAVAATSQARVLSGRVLLVDDLQTNLYLNGQLLESLQLTVATASSGVEAVNCLQQSDAPFDLILLDLNMPDMDGFDAARKIRSVPGYANANIVALSAYTADNMRQRAQEEQFVQFLSKPIQRNELIACLERWMPASAAEVVVPEVAEALADDHFVDSDYDGSVLAELAKNIGRDKLPNLVSKFLEESAEQWEALRLALQERNLDSVVLHAHTLASTTLAFGLIDAGTQLRQMENRALSGELPHLTELDRMSQTLGLGISKLQAHLTTLG